MVTLFDLSQLVLEHSFLLSNHFQLIDPGIGVLDLLVCAFQVKGKLVLAFPELCLILLEGEFYLFVRGLPA